MKRRYSFLSPLAVAVVALTTGGITQNADAKLIIAPGDDQAVRELASTAIPGSSAIVLTRNASGEIRTAQHQSHWSHSSHASHASHQSHYSSRF
jgi:hypothetical protein